MREIYLIYSLIEGGYSPIIAFAQIPLLEGMKKLQ
jgi:hypothetical protein